MPHFVCVLPLSTTNNADCNKSEKYHCFYLIIVLLSCCMFKFYQEWYKIKMKQKMNMHIVTKIQLKSTWIPILNDMHCVWRRERKRASEWIVWKNIFVGGFRWNTNKSTTQWHNFPGITTFNNVVSKNIFDAVGKQNTRRGNKKSAHICSNNINLVLTLFTMNELQQLHVLVSRKFIVIKSQKPRDACQSLTLTNWERKTKLRTHYGVTIYTWISVVWLLHHNPILVSSFFFLILSLSQCIKQLLICAIT